MEHPEAPDHDRPPEGERVTFRRSDFVLLRRAARERWGVPDGLMSEALFQAAKILAGPDSDDRNRLAAMRFLVAADRADLAAELSTARAGQIRAALAADLPDATDGDGVRAGAAARALEAINSETSANANPEPPADRVPGGRESGPELQRPGDDVRDPPGSPEGL